MILCFLRYTGTIHAMDVGNVNCYLNFLLAAIEFINLSITQKDMDAPHSLHVLLQKNISGSSISATIESPGILHNPSD